MLAKSCSTDGRLIYAIGDVHGRVDLLLPLLREIIADAMRSSPRHRPLLVFLGDYVDRGPQSRSVVDLILKLRDNPAFEVRTLKGNHEEGLLAFLADPAFGPTWAAHGGGATLASYGVPLPKQTTDAEAWRIARDMFVDRLPAAHLNWFGELELIIAIGDYAFVHAGVRPERPLAEQDERDVLWIRDDFLESRVPPEKIVVHGHTPDATPGLRHRRLGLDTGAYASGVLTAARLDGGDRRLIQARDENAARKLRSEAAQRAKIADAIR